MTISWTAGNGSARLIVARADFATDWTPVDGVVYYAGIFGAGASYGTNSDNFIVYNGNGVNYLKCTNLPPGHKYYFTIFEHDNNGSFTQYYTSGAPSISDSTFYVKLDYDIVYHDSCEMKNSYTFINRSSSNITGLKYTFHFDQNHYSDSSMNDTATHSYVRPNFTPGLVPSMITANTNTSGCKNSLIKSVKVYQKVVALMDWSFNHDTVMCLANNFFWFKTKAVTNPLSGSYGYRWFTEYDTTSFSFFKKTFPEAGRHKISVEITTNISKGGNQYATNCKDTLRFYVNLRPKYIVNILVNKDTQEIHSNLFNFGITDSTQGSAIWSFGDGDTSHRLKTTHQYNDTGHYTVDLLTYGAQACPGEGTFSIYVYDSTLIADTTTNDTTLSLRTVFRNAPKVYPNPSGGVFTIESAGIDRVTVYDLSGRKLEGIKTNGESRILIDLRHLEKGLYMLKLEEHSQSSTVLIRIQ